MIYQPLDTVKVRLRDAILRREQGLPQADDDGDLLKRALDAIEGLEGKDDDYSPYGGCDCECHDDE